MIITGKGRPKFMKAIRMGLVSIMILTMATSILAQSNTTIDYEQLRKHLQLEYQTTVFADSLTVPLISFPDSLLQRDQSTILKYLAANQGIGHVYYNPRVILLYKRSNNYVDTGDQLPISSYRVQGYLIDAQSGSHLRGTLIIPESNMLINTDEQGYFTFTLPEGSYSLKALGQGTFESNLELNLEGDRSINIELFEKTVQLDEVVVSTKVQDVNVVNLQPGALTLEIEDLKKIPALLGEIDVSRAVIALPGVSTVGEGATGFNVRGGNIDQNLILMDGMTLFNSSHLLGFFSAFNPDVLRDFTLYKGLIPADKGGRVSSVLEVNQKGANPDAFGFSASVGPLNSKLYMNIPIIEESTGFSIGIRGAYPNYVLSSFPDESRVSDSRASYYDITTKIDHSFEGGALLTVDGYFSGDEFNLSADTSFNYSNLLLGLKYLNPISDKWTMNIHGFMSRYQAGIEDRTLNQESDFENGISQYSLNGFFTYHDNGPKYSFGFETNYYDFVTGEIYPASPTSDIGQEKFPDRKALEVSVYASTEIQLSDRLGLQAGIRSTSFFNLGPDQFFLFEGEGKNPELISDTLNLGSGELNHVNTSFEPRVALNYRLNSNSSIKAGYSRTYQNLHLLSNTVASLPTDLWRPSDPNLEPVTAHLLSLGYFRNFRDNLFETSLEVFYKDIENNIEFTNGTRVLLNPDLVFNTLQGEAEAYGVELLLKKTRGDFTAQIGYTYSRSWSKFDSELEDQTLNDGSSFPSNFDRPHDINVFGNWKAGRLWNLSANFVYTTGRPISLPQASFRFGGAIGFTDIERNNFRVPDFHRLDLAVTLEGSNKKGKKLQTSWTFSIYNVYGRKNVFSVFINGEDGRPRQLSVLGAPFPSLTFNIKLQ